MKKQRLDHLLVQRGLAESRQKAQAYILSGSVTSGDRVFAKPGEMVGVDIELSLAPAPAYVGRGGEKLAGALEHFGLDPAGLVVADIGASTGGFTDCLLKRGAIRVYAIDVGYGQLDLRLRQDPRVVVLERVNARYLTSLPEQVDLVTIDVSFISLEKILPAAVRLLKAGGQVLALVKPQFEAGRHQVRRGGVVRDPAVHREVLARVAGFAQGLGLGLQGVAPSRLLGPAGNREFFLWWVLGAPSAEAGLLIEQTVPSPGT